MDRTVASSLTRQACDRCHELKLRCQRLPNNVNLCERCHVSGLSCTYSQPLRTGRPREKGSAATPWAETVWKLDSRDTPRIGTASKGHAVEVNPDACAKDTIINNVYGMGNGPPNIEGEFNGISPIHADATLLISSASQLDPVMFNADLLNEDSASLPPVPPSGSCVLHPILAEHAWSSPADHVWDGCLQKILSLQTSLFSSSSMCTQTRSISKTHQDAGIEYIASMTQQLMDVFLWHSQLCPAGCGQLSCAYHHRVDFMTLLILTCYVRLLHAYMGMVSSTNIPSYHDGLVDKDSPESSYSTGASLPEVPCTSPLTAAELRDVAQASIFGHLLNRLNSSAQSFIRTVSNSVQHRCCPVGIGIALSITPMLTAVASLEKPLRLRLNGEDTSVK